MRALLKEEAKKQFRAQYLPCVGVSAVSALITLGLTWITGQTTDTQAILDTVLVDPQGALGQSMLYTLLMLFITVFTGTISVESAYFFLCVFRGEQRSIRDFLTGLVTDVGKKVGVQLRTLLFVFLWCMAAMVPFIVTVVVLSSAMDAGNALSALDALLWVFACAVGVLAIIKTLSYSMMPYLIRDCPQVTVRKSMRLSIALTKGNKGKLFVLILSFVGWMLLAAVTFGVIGILYAGPYVATTMAGFYHYLKRDGLASGVINEGDLEAK